MQLFSRLAGCQRVARYGRAQELELGHVGADLPLVQEAEKHRHRVVENARTIVNHLNTKAVEQFNKSFAVYRDTLPLQDVLKFQDFGAQNVWYLILQHPPCAQPSGQQTFHVVFIKQLETVYKLKGTESPKYFLEADIEVLDEHWQNKGIGLVISTRTYIGQIIPKFEQLFSITRTLIKTPMDENYHPEIDTMS